MIYPLHRRTLMTFPFEGQNHYLKEKFAHKQTKISKRLRMHLRLSFFVCVPSLEELAYNDGHVCGCSYYYPDILQNNKIVITILRKFIILQYNIDCNHMF